MKPLLEVSGLKTWFKGETSFIPWKHGNFIKAVDGVSFNLQAGEVLSLVGESGCGKSTVGRTLTRLEESTDGTARLMGEEILDMSDTTFKPMRRHIQMIFQDPFASLNPRLTIEKTLSEPLFIHGLVSSKAEAREKVSQILIDVGLDPMIMQRYPHEFSGGQRQRIGIARVMVLSPKLIIADEAVSALDVSIQAQVLNLLKDLQRDSGVSMLFISHDLGVVRHISDRIAVMYLGKIVEIGDKQSIFSNPSHPYTRLLLDSIPRPTPQKSKQRIEVTGEPASASSPPPGCAFNPRCPLASENCKVIGPELTAIADDHYVACHNVTPPPSVKGKVS